MRGALLLLIGLALASCGPETADDAAVLHIGGTVNAIEQPPHPAEEVLEGANHTPTPQTKPPQATLRVLNFYHGLVLASYLDYVQRYSESAQSRSPLILYDVDGDTLDGNSFSTYLKSLRQNRITNPSSVLHRFFSRLASTPTPSGLGSGSLLDGFNTIIRAMVLQITDQQLNEDIWLQREFYDSPLRVVAPASAEQAAIVELGSFPLWLTTLKRYPDQVDDSVDGLDAVTYAVVSRYLELWQKTLTDLLFGETSVLRWRVGSNTFPLLQPLPADGTRKQIVVPVRGHLELLRRTPGSSPSFLSLNAELHRTWVPHQTSDILYEAHLLGARRNFLGFLDRSYSETLRILDCNSGHPRCLPAAAGEAAKLLPILRTGTPASTYFLERPFTHRYFQQNNPDFRRMIEWTGGSGCPRISSNTWSPDDLRVLRFYLKFLLELGRLDPRVQQSRGAFPGGAGGMTPGSELLLRSGILCDNPISSPLDIFLAMTIAHLSIANWLQPSL